MLHQSKKETYLFLGDELELRSNYSIHSHYEPTYE